MKSKSLNLLGAALVLAGCSGQPATQPSGDHSEAATGAGSEAGPPPLNGDPSKNPDMTGLAAQVDTNDDGRMSAAEWKAQGLPESSFNMFEKGRGYVTLNDYRTNAAPPGIDINGDGTLTAAEFKQFDREMTAKMKGNPSPAGTN